MRKTPYPKKPRESEVKVGQVWKSNDWRDTPYKEGEKFWIVRSIQEDRVHCQRVDKGLGEGEFIPRDRVTNIRKDRFRPISTGYILVRETPNE